LLLCQDRRLDLAKRIFFSIFEAKYLALFDFNGLRAHEFAVVELAARAG